MTRRNDERPGRPQAAPWVLAALAGVQWLVGLPLFLFGLIAPLTPSEGYPTAPAMMLHAGLPLALCVASCGLSRNVVIRVLSIAQALFIAGVTAWLLAIQSGIA